MVVQHLLTVVSPSENEPFSRFIQDLQTKEFIQETRNFLKFAPCLSEEPVKI